MHRLFTVDAERFCLDKVQSRATSFEEVADPVSTE